MFETFESRILQISQILLICGEKIKSKLLIIQTFSQLYLKLVMIFLFRGFL